MEASQYRDSLDSSLGSPLDLRKIIIKILTQQQGHKHSLTVLRWGTPAWERNSLGNEMEKSKFLGTTCPSPLQARAESLHRFLCHLSLPHCQESGLALGWGLPHGTCPSVSSSQCFPPWMPGSGGLVCPMVAAWSPVWDEGSWHCSMAWRSLSGAISLPRTQSPSTPDREHIGPGF